MAAAPPVAIAEKSPRRRRPRRRRAQDGLTPASSPSAEGLLGLTSPFVVKSF